MALSAMENLPMAERVNIEVHDYAQRSEQHILDLYRMLGTSWVDLGIALMTFHDQQTYVKLGHTSFNAWIQDRKLPRSTFYGCMEKIRKLENKIPVSELKGLSQANAHQLLEIPDSKWTKYLPQAKTMTEVEFHDLVQAEDGQWLNQEVRVFLRWQVDKSLRDLIVSCIKTVKEIEKTQSDQMALERIFSLLRDNLPQGEYFSKEDFKEEK